MPLYGGERQGLGGRRRWRRSDVADVVVALPSSRGQNRFGQLFGRHHHPRPRPDTCRARETTGGGVAQISRSHCSPVLG